MKLSANDKHPDYHPVAYYGKVFINAGRTQLNNCVSFDTATGEYWCYTRPFKSVEDLLSTTKAVDETLYFEFMDDVPEELVDDWYKRELGELT